MDQIHSTRESWLVAAVEELRPIYSIVGFTLPQSIRVTCGFPSTANRSGAVGQCWSDKASADNTTEILISPTIDSPSRVFDIMIHELAHSAPGCMNHGVKFQGLCGEMGLIPAQSSWKATIAGPDFDSRYSAIIDSLGVYPHAKLSTSKRKVQGTRMLKLVCPSCGYSVRTTQTWLSMGMPVCGIDGETFTLGA